jgi:hypothetical protein
VQDELDIMPAITEEAYLVANPSARPARALQLMCAEGDVEAIIDLLQRADGHDEDDEEEEEKMDSTSLLRYQDPLNGMSSNLHLAVENKQEEVLWLLLWLASNVPTDSFPAPAIQAATDMELPRQQVGPGTGKEDIRALRDEQGRYAGDLCNNAEHPWYWLIQGGVLPVQGHS